MELAPFTDEMGTAVASWPIDARECVAWSSTEVVTGDDVVGWSTADDIEAWVVLDDDGRPCAYGEIWIDADEREVELARLIVAPDRRGSGIGRRFVGELSERASMLYTTVVMRVRGDNVAARRCYAAAGFERVPASDEAAWNVGQPVDYVWMRLSTGNSRSGAG